MHRTLTRAFAVATLAAALSAAAVGARDGAPQRAATTLAGALVFHAPFDGDVNARIAAGDPALYWAPTWNRRSEAQPGLPPSGDTRHVPRAGRFGDALQFTRRGAPIVFFNGGPNSPFAERNWQGTASLWLSTDPDGELQPGFCDPIQLLGRAWNDASLWVEFEKRPQDVPFRLGVYADLDVWNPTKRRIQDIPSAERPLLTVDRPPFAKGKWTHVVFTWESFNTGGLDGVARLYLNGQPHGALTGRQQTFTWDPAQSAITLGLNYIGLLDELVVFNRALTGDEVEALFKLERGVASLPR
jgi:Concanavalin A-like lectin/glucanases superfamily